MRKNYRLILYHNLDTKKNLHSTLILMVDLPDSWCIDLMQSSIHDLKQSHQFINVAYLHTHISTKGKRYAFANIPH